MDIDTANASTHQPVPLDEEPHLLIVSHGRRRQLRQESQHGLSVLEVAACQLTDHGRMIQDPVGLELKT